MRTSSILALAALGLLQSTLAASAQSLPPATDASPGLSNLPSSYTSQAIRQLPKVEYKTWTKRSIKPRELVIDKGNLDNIGREKAANSGGTVNSLPFVVPDTMIIQFAAKTTPADVEDYLRTNNLKVVQTYPGIGAVQVKADLTRFFQPKLTDTSVNDSIIRGMTEAAKEFKKDSRIRSATPDILLTDKQADGDSIEITNVLHPTDIITALVETDASEVSDWGIADIEADQLWTMPGANDGVIFGVMDVGFGRHNDLTFISFPTASGRDNHGNHVAGIGCGRHDGVGTKGVLPNCFVRARSGDVFFEGAGGNPQLGFMVLFSQILSTLDRFVTEEEDVSAFNVSLGYNWRSNFGINPDLPESGQWRQLVEMQGTLLVSLLELAQSKDKIIFSAAGNDSTGLDTPIGAKYASPFNWAAIVAREQGLATNGVIVGAHGTDGTRASFSNSGADISCPGVNIMSTLAFDASDQPSASSYGKMSGTSMASPYCASAYILFRLVRPGYTSTEAMQCMRQSDQNNGEGTPRLKLTQALTACPARS